MFLFLYCIGNSNYLIINCVPKLVWGFSQAIRLRRINNVFYSILFCCKSLGIAAVLTGQDHSNKEEKKCVQHLMTFFPFLVFNVTMHH